MTTPVLECHIQQQLLQQSARSFALQWQEQRIWIKRPEKTSNRWLQLLPRLLASFSTNPLYFPSAEKTPQLLREAKRLNLLRQKGFNVPEVLVATEDFLALSDVGSSLKYWLTEAKISSEEQQHILVEAAVALANIHQHRFWHGRPALRDICWDGKQIGFIDFEEDPYQYLSIDQCMARDFLIFVHGLYRYLPADAEMINIAITTYRQHAPERVWQDSLKIVEGMWLVYPLLELSHNILGKDGKQALLALRSLRKLNRSRGSKLPWLLISALLAYALADQFD